VTNLFKRVERASLAIVAIVCLVSSVRAGVAQTQTARFVLQDAWLDPDITHPWEPPQLMTGTIEWTYTVGNFDNGTGEFVELGLPWHLGQGPALAWSMDVGQIEITMPGNWHNWGADVSIKLAQPLSLGQPAPIDLVLSKFDIEANGVPRKGHFLSGSVVPLSPFDTFCYGDGTGTACPCGNPGGLGEGCENSSGAGGVLAAGGSASVGADDLTFAAANLPANGAALLISGTGQANAGSGVVLGDGLLCVGGTVRRLVVAFPGVGGNANWGPGLVAMGGWSAGVTQYFQCWYRDASGSPCASGFNLTNGVSVSFVP